MGNCSSVKKASDPGKECKWPKLFEARDPQVDDQIKMPEKETPVPEVMNETGQVQVQVFDQSTALPAMFQVNNEQVDPELVKLSNSAAVQ